MAASTWRMNRLWRRMAGVLVLCALMLSNEVTCQEDSSAAPEVTSAANPNAGTDAMTAAPTPDAPTPDAAAPDAAAPGASAAPTAVDSVTAGGQDPTASGGPGDTIFPATAPYNSNNRIDTTTGGPRVAELVVPEVKCVEKNEIQESNAVKAVVTTPNCEVLKGIIQASSAFWCKAEPCNINISQDGSNLLVTSDDAKMGTIAEALQSEGLKKKLGVSSIETPSSSGSSSVFIGVLVTGLLAAIGITVGSLKFQRRADPKGVRLAEEAYPVDQENQGNTLVSVAPLNPPQETQEKPSENGEAPEAPKTEPAPPPTNGHSTAKTADTEL